jgi:hypothetical protein
MSRFQRSSLLLKGRLVISSVTFRPLSFINRAEELLWIRPRFVQFAESRWFQTRTFFMRSTLFIIIAAFWVSCARTPDAIDRLVADLSSTHGMWLNGYFHDVKLPRTASTEQVVEQYFREAVFDTGRANAPLTRVTNYKILKIRQVHIPDFNESDSYTAVLVQTNFGQKIILLKRGDGWWSRAYDANRIYFKKIDNGDTPLHKAVSEDKKDMVEQLLVNKAEVNATNIYGWTPLFYAAMSGNKDIVALLLANKAEVNTKANNNGWTPLHLAALFGHKDVAALLLANKADINAKDNSGRTPLQLAVQNGLDDEDVVELLLVNKAEINARDNIGETLLHYAAQWGHKDVAELLLAHKAEVNATNNYGETPLYFAVARNHKEVADLLRQYGGHE